MTIRKARIAPSLAKKTMGIVAAILVAAALTVAASAEAGFVNTKQTGLNVRTGPGLTYSIITSLPKGTRFEILSESGEWTKISYGNITGYVHSSYVGRYASPQAKKYPAVNLSVPYYTQYDSRWASMKLGTSNVKNIGCTVTCTAMSESFRTGTAITPATIVRTSSFTPGGALYWPSHYTRYTGSDWMAYAYNQLAAGRPVIFHGQKWSGTSHWVIIYGYAGGDTLTADGFLIRDPASPERTTLAQYFKLYPSYVKLVHYIG
ncbi:MAG TPA: SH3 domain-containing protein [Bacillota bacterium]|nr:SH3 domain-containing protein [Clostridiales bacterium]HPT84691.1 SH3 domain-containing protein [Bacillota bacterium]